MQYPVANLCVRTERPCKTGDQAGGWRPRREELRVAAELTLHVCGEMQQ